VHRGYPSEKPSELSEVFIRQSSSPGDLVVDPFVGSGSVGVAALRLGRRFAGGDVSATALAVATPRLGEAVAHRVATDEPHGEGPDGEVPDGEGPDGERRA